MRVVILALMAGLGLAVRAQEQQQPKRLNDFLSGMTNLTKFQSLVQSYSDLDAGLSLAQGLTILAPSDDAFDKLPVSSLNPIFEANDTDAIRDVLVYHVLKGIYPKAAFNNSAQFPSTFLEDIAVEKVEGGQKVLGVQQIGDVVFVSGLGSRSSLKSAVSN